MFLSDYFENQKSFPLAPKTICNNFMCYSICSKQADYLKKKLIYGKCVQIKSYNYNWQVPQFLCKCINR